MYAVGRYFCLNPFTVTGNVAENRQICLSAGHFAISASSAEGKKKRGKKGRKEGSGGGNMIGR
jgi:hypothetical protein